MRIFLYAKKLFSVQCSVLVFSLLTFSWKIVEQNIYCVNCRNHNCPESTIIINGIKYVSIKSNEEDIKSQSNSVFDCPIFVRFSEFQFTFEKESSYNFVISKQTKSKIKWSTKMQMHTKIWTHARTPLQRCTNYRVRKLNEMQYFK